VTGMSSTVADEVLRNEIWRPVFFEALKDGRKMSRSEDTAKLDGLSFVPGLPALISAIASNSWWIEAQASHAAFR
jgi:hypothetical protein